MSEVVEQDPALVKRAQELGWADKDSWRGDPDKWVPAEEFIRRGEEILPIVRSQAKKLEQQNAELKAQLEGLQANMQEFTAYQREQMKLALERQKTELLALRKEAREAGDDDRLEELSEQLDGVKEKAKALDTPPKLPEPADPPELLAWKAENPWFGGKSKEDQRKTALAMQFGREANAQGLVKQDFLDYIDREMAALNPRPNADKTEGVTRQAGGESSTVKGYRDLPPDAKAQCDADEKRFVGKGKMFATQAEWRAHYVAQYN